MKKLGLLVAVALTLITTAALALDRHVRVTNRTDQTVRYLYGSNAAEETWQEDILGEKVLPSGSSVLVNFYDGTDHCLYDIKVVFSDGHAAYKAGFNVCQESDLFIY